MFSLFWTFSEFLSDRSFPEFYSLFPELFSLILSHFAGFWVFMCHFLSFFLIFLSFLLSFVNFYHWKIHAICWVFFLILLSFFLSITSTSASLEEQLWVPKFPSITFTKPQVTLSAFSFLEFLWVPLSSLRFPLVLPNFDLLEPLSWERN